MEPPPVRRRPLFEGLLQVFPDSSVVITAPPRAPPPPPVQRRRRDTRPQPRAPKGRCSGPRSAAPNAPEPGVLQTNGACDGPHTAHEVWARLLRSDTRGGGGLASAGRTPQTPHQNQKNIPRENETY